MRYQHDAHKSAQPCTFLVQTFDTRIIGYEGQEVAEATGRVPDAGLDTSHKGEEEGSTCSNCSTSDSRNGTQDCCWEEQRDAATEVDIRDEEEEENRQHQTPPAEDKSVDTTDLKASLG
ncbi:uncharacterized protein TNCV_736911 [Trichonephila clavipes]|nr:uncharacterized protein TNCV_736911 [Trichonephila clavipes]